MNKRIVLITIIVIAVSLAGIVIFLDKTNKPWYFKGAYAKYNISGSAALFDISGFETVTILDYNSTHLKIKYATYIDSPMTDINITTKWKPIHGYNLKNCILLSKENMKINGLPLIKETYKCKINDNTFDETYYREPHTLFFIKVIRDNFFIHEELTLIDTNITLLKPYIGIVIPNEST